MLGNIVQSNLDVGVNRNWCFIFYTNGRYNFDGIYPVVLWQTSSNLYITIKHNKFTRSNSAY